MKTKLESKAISGMLLVIAMLCVSQNVIAQDRWNIEFRPGVNFATQKLGEAKLKTGYGFEGTLAYRFMAHFSAYAGWSWNKFGSDQKMEGTTLGFEETGYTFGLQYKHPIGNSKINFLARAGGLYNHIEVEQGDDIISDSGHGLGWQAEGGLAIPLGKNWDLMPGIRYRSLARDVMVNNISTPVNLNYISVGVGTVLKF